MSTPNFPLMPMHPEFHDREGIDDPTVEEAEQAEEADEEAEQTHVFTLAEEDKAAEGQRGDN